MGMNMSFMGMGEKGMSESETLSLLTDKLWEQFIHKDITDFPGFYVAILDTFSTINMALPGNHYAPSHKDVMDLFKKVDKTMITTAIVAPPTAMVVKRTGQRLPQLKFMKSVPDAVFVLSATALALIGVKIQRLMFMKKEVQHLNSINNFPPAPSDDDIQPRTPVVVTYVELNGE